jgi:hypothetical protein
MNFCVGTREKSVEDVGDEEREESKDWILALSSIPNIPTLP